MIVAHEHARTVAQPDAVLSSVTRSVPGRATLRPGEIHFTGTVPAMMRDVVEDLFFFNSRQALLIQQIQSMIEQTGVPLIVEREDRIWIEVPSGSMQCLFACDRATKPLGVALYSRPSPDLLWIAHLAVDPVSSLLGDEASGLARAMVNRIRDIARSINGVTRLQLPYRRGSFLRV